MPDKVQKAFNETFNEVRAWLDDLRSLGLDSLPVADLRALQPCPPGIVGRDRGGSSGCRQETLAEIRSDLGDCRRCPLCTSRRLIVFGEGAARSGILVVGGAPSKREDTAGRPLGGELFERILFALGLERSSLYLCQAVMCHPLGRPPRPEEIAACFPFLQRQIEVVAPRIIVALGEVATRILTNQQEEFTLLRGRWSKYQGIDVMPTLDPAYLLLHPQEKRELWNDLKEVLRRMQEED